MDPVYIRIQNRAKEIVSRHPRPDFYISNRPANTLSQKLFESDPVVCRLRKSLFRFLENDFGHGLEHAKKVSLDAGALMIIEGEAAGFSRSIILRKTRIVHCAGLLHDIKRKQRDHALKGAHYAKKTLREFPFSEKETGQICEAIRRHEAFKETPPIKDPEGSLICDCLYDGDKFRWGPDNFSSTIWDMVAFFKTPLSEFVDYYPRGMEGLEKIRGTFRSATGRRYGPQFIDIGIAIGNELYRVIRNEFSEFL